MFPPVRGFAGGTGQRALPQPVVITTTGSTFSPWVQVASQNVTVTWTWSGGQVTGLTPVINFGTAATRQVTMTATNSAGYPALNLITMFNIGFSSLDDQGRYSLPASYDWTPQAVSGLANVNSMTGLQLFLAAGIAGLTGGVAFDGMSALTHIECYQSSLTQASVYGCTSMVRVVIEQNRLSAFNANPVAATLGELRLAFQQTGVLALTPLTQAMPNLYHFCVRDQTVTGMPDFSSGFPALTQLWIWNTGQSGVLTVGSSVQMDSVLAHNNAYTTAGLANQFPFTGGQLTGQIAMASCSLTSVNITGDGQLFSVDFSNNQLPQSQVDSVLTTMNGYNTTDSLGVINVSGTGNAAPSATGSAAAVSLRGRGWTVTTN